MERNLRRNQNVLIITGIGTIALTVWSIIKTVLFIELDSGRFEELFRSMLGEMYQKKVAVTIVFILLGFDLLFRLFVGLRARSEGHGKHCGYFYLVIDAIFIIIAAYDIVYYFTPGNETVSISDTFVTIVFELTSLYTYADLMYASLRVKSIRKKMKEDA